MQTTTLTDLFDVPAVPKGRAVTIGAFDGVHLGHQALLRLVRDLARARELTATLLTFDRHPAEVVRPEVAPKVLTTLEQKLELLAALDAVDECMVLPFDEARSRESAEEFVDDILASLLRTRLVVVGADFHFGNRRHGDVPLLQRMGAEIGFEVLGLGLVAAPDGSIAASGALPYSSTRVRTLLARGDVEGAAAILGRPHEVRGELERADGDVALVLSSRICLPAPGIYRTDGGTAMVVDDEGSPTRRVWLDGDPREAVRFFARAD
ncbi:MAG TPA: FAD synthetase family protein [Acidimicrobiia bacterium]|nr:FAD synthetase family protein [Acidimicrobiia bacterium]